MVQEPLVGSAVKKNIWVPRKDLVLLISSVCPVQLEAELQGHELEVVVQVVLVIEVTHFEVLHKVRSYEILTPSSCW
jgi:hypothetical protein